MTDFRSRLPLLWVPIMVLVLARAPMAAAEAEPEVQSNPYFVALLQIGLRKEQVPRFQELLAEYANDRQAAIDRALRGRQGNLAYRVRREKSKVTDRFFARMDRLLDDEQFGRFPPFHDELDKMLLERESLEEFIDEEGAYPNQT